ncbi:hypothetical protein [Alistipes ihumii]|uniref:hypothetical protein n=1 Tax=Alistipes ihumii TaxID=1470347 RepID=UPI002658C37C|nr:hypothetical protein [Alistipes ihumii]
MAKLKFETTANLKPIDNLLTRIKELEQHIASLKKEMRSINAADPKIDPLLKDLKASKEEINNLVAEINRIKQAQLDRQREQEQAATREKESIASLLRAYEELRQKVADTANKSTSPSSGANNAPSIKEETQAYDELLSKIRTLLGSREETIASMLREENAIRLIKKELKGLQKLESDGINLTEAQRQRRIQLTSSLEEHKQSVSQLKQILANEIKSEQAVRGSMNEMSQSLGTMRMFYRTLNEEERNTQFGQELLKRIQLVDTKIKELDASIGNHQRNVGNYASHWDGLGFSIQQVARELPSISYGLNVFFGAISNNLSILADDIRRAIAKYKAAVAEGKAATPVWKQIVKSIFSWQTALVGGITLLTLYGDKIAAWVAGLFKGKDAIDANAASIEVLNTRIEANRNALDSANREFGSQMGNISRLRSEWSKLGNDMNAKLKFVNDNKSGFSQLGVSVNSVADAEKVLIGNTDAVVASLKARAQATAYQNTLTELYAKQLEAEQRQEAYEAQAKGRRYVPGVQEDARKRAIRVAASRSGGMMSSMEELDVERLTEQFLNEETQKYEHAAEKERLIKEGYAKQIQEIDKALTKSLNQSAQALIEAGLTPSGDNTTVQATQDKILSAREALAEALRANESELQKSLLGIMAEGQEKELAQLDNATREKLHKIEEARQKTIAAYAAKGQEPNPDELAKLDETKANEEKAAELARAAIIAKYARQEEELWRNVTDVFLTDEERKQQGIQKTFDEYRRQAESLLKGGSIGESDYNALVGQIGRAETKSMLQDVLREYETFEQQKGRIAEEYNDKIAQLEEQNANGQYNENIEKIKRQRDLEIAQLQISESDFFQVISGNLEEYGLATIRDAIAQAKEYLDNFIADAKSKNGGKLTNEQLQFVTQMRQNIDQATQAVYNRLPEGLAKAASGMKKVADSAKELDESLGNVLDTVSNMIQGFSDIESGISGLKEASANFKQMKQDAKDQGKSLGFGDILGTVGSYAGAIGSIVSGVTGIFSSIGNLFDDQAKYAAINAEYARRQEAYWESINFQVERYTKLLEEAAGEDYFTTAAEQMDILNESLAKARKNLINDIPQGEVDSVTFGLFNLLRSGKQYDFIANSEAQEIYDFIQQNGGYSRDEGLSIEAAYALKESADIWSKMPDWMQESVEKMIEINEQTEELKETLNENLFQTTSKDLEDAIIEGLKNGKKGVDEFGSEFEEVMRNALLQSFAINELRPMIKKFYEKYTQLADSDENGKLDLTKDEIDTLRKEWNDIITGATEGWENFKQIVGYTESSDASTQSATSRGFQTMSQDTGNELNGRFSDLQMKGQQIIDINTGIRDIASEIRQLQVESLLELRGINENTGNTVKILKMHTSMLSKISDNTSRI